MQLNKYETEHIELLRPYLSECCVLLKNKGDFPAKSPSLIAAYGSGVRDTVKGGTGSGEVNSRYYDTVEQGLEKAGFTITTKKWLDSYEKVKAEAFEKFKKDLKAKAKSAHSNVLMMCMGASMPAPEYTLPIDGEGDTAIYVIARESGENTDRSVEKGEILLSDTEIREILAINEKYSHFMLVLNTGGVVDLSPVAKVDNILLISQLGVETGDVLAAILTGKANPSGKLTATWAAVSDYPEMVEFGGYDETKYKEGIYVGYRYFDSADAKPMFPFGYGLSYTSFEIIRRSVVKSGSIVRVMAAVKNTGSFSGKEVVQLYVSKPTGVLNQPYQMLAAFKKTALLAAGECEEIQLEFDLKDIASYDMDSECYLLEKGTYILRLGNSSRSTVPVGTVELDENIITYRVKNCLGKTDFVDYSSGAHRIEKLSDDVVRLRFSAADIVTEQADYDRKYLVCSEAERLSNDELLHFAMGAFNPKGGTPGAVVGNSADLVAGAAGETFSTDSIPSLVMADGPAGLRLAQNYFEDKKGIHSMAPPMPESMMKFASAPLKFLMSLSTPRPKRKEDICHQYCTAVPIGTAIAQSFNEELAILCGDIVGREMEIFGIDLWLAPALNIQRSIRCGRNFEYYSEDPLVSGKMAAGITKGVQKHPHKGVTVKHFAANNQEFNRTSSNSVVSERAMREIYLKGFEICIKESAPRALMTSYNLINGIHASENKGLLADILRCEFGYDGLVMTDWVIDGGMIPKDARYGSPDPAGVAAAGGDVYMPGHLDDFNNLKDGFEKGRVSVQQLKINATRIINCLK